MKIVVKQSDKYTSELHDDRVVYQYIIYIYDTDNRALSCEEVMGEDEKNDVIKSYLSRMKLMGDIEVTPETTYDTLYDEYVKFVLFDEFKEAIIENKPTYNHG